MVMTKLFNKLLTASATVLAAFCSFACSDKIAGTAEEPNQFAYGTQSSSSIDRSIVSDSGKSLETPNDYPIITSSATSPTPSVQISSSSRSEEDGYNPIHTDPALSSSSTGGSGGAGSPGFGNPGNCYCPIGYTCHCGPTVEPASTLDDYLKKYNITEATYDDNVLGYNVTLTYCDSTKQNCAELSSTACLRNSKRRYFKIARRLPALCTKHLRLIACRACAYQNYKGHHRHHRNPRQLRLRTAPVRYACRIPVRVLW